MARRRNTAASEKNLRPPAYEICVQRACSEVRALKDLLQAELRLEKAAGRQRHERRKKKGMSGSATRYCPTSPQKLKT
jgi:hypothetical protein